jgi:hypothetical protein
MNLSIIIFISIIVLLIIIIYVLQKPPKQESHTHKIDFKIDNPNLSENELSMLIRKDFKGGDIQEIIFLNSDEIERFSVGLQESNEIEQVGGFEIIVTGTNEQIEESSQQVENDTGAIALGDSLLDDSCTTHPHCLQGSPPCLPGSRSHFNRCSIPMENYYLSGGIPTRHRECNSIEYETEPPTETSNRECTRLRTCNDNKYESVSPDATTNRECTLITTCTETQYVQSEPTINLDGKNITDRICLDLTPECNETHFESVQPIFNNNLRYFDNDRICVSIDEGCEPINGALTQVECRTFGPMNELGIGISTTTECNSGTF